ncbi:pyridoxal 5'-phosphate synthase subunit PdxT [Bacteroidia bacterium]|nr:pyridoxal 5'-phosphate synthase subunit PdxT [Bacteroidia bacterium]
MVGILALQGAYQKHYDMVKSIGENAMFVRSIEDLSSIDAMILPGGESTTIGKLLDWYGLLNPLKQRIEAGMPTLGTCAGMIMLAKETENHQPNLLEVMDIKVERNAYGAQIESFETDIDVKGFYSPFPAIFIRAPKITQIGDNVEVLAEHNGTPILIKERNIIAASFHPELTNDDRIHKLILSNISSIK